MTRRVMDVTGVTVTDEPERRGRSVMGGFRAVANTRANGEVPPIRPFAWMQSGGSVDLSKPCAL
jgi:hypothetical protein